MTIADSIKKIKDLFASHNLPLEVTEKVEVKFATAKLNDGITVVEWDGDLVTGTIVYVVDENGKNPLPAGQYVLEDGTSFDIVDNTGLADNVVKAEETTEVPEATPSAEAPEMAQAPTAPTAQPKAVVESIVKETRFISEESFNEFKAEIESKFSALEKENKELSAKLVKAEELNKEVFAVVEKIADEPLQTPQEEIKQEFKSEKKSLKERQKELTKSFRESIYK